MFSYEICSLFLMAPIFIIYVIDLSDENEI